MGVFRDQQIARMREVEMTSDVLAAMLKGITDIAKLSAVYKEFDDELPQHDELERRFREIIGFIRCQLIDAVRATKFRLQVRTYSLMVALADSLNGIPGGFGPLPVRPGPEICTRMMQVDDALKPAEVPAGLAELKKSLTSATSHVREREVRNNHFVKMLSMTNEDWQEHWHAHVRGNELDD